MEALQAPVVAAGECCAAGAQARGPGRPRGGDSAARPPQRGGAGPRDAMGPPTRAPVGETGAGGGVSDPQGRGEGAGP